MEEEAIDEHEGVELSTGEEVLVVGACLEQGYARSEVLRGPRISAFRSERRRRREAGRERRFPVQDFGEDCASVHLTRTIGGTVLFRNLMM